MVDNRGDVVQTVPTILWPTQIVNITASLFNVDSDLISLELQVSPTMYDQDTIQYHAEWTNSTCGVYFDVTRDGTQITIIDGYDDDQNDTIDAQAVDAALTQLL